MATTPQQAQQQCEQMSTNGYFWQTLMHRHGLCTPRWTSCRTTSSDHIMALPPPHELARPIAPCLPSPGTASHTCDDPGVCNYAYVHDAAPAQAPAHRAFSNPGTPFSPQFRTSTNISQYDLVSARNGNGNGRSSSGGSRSGRDALPGLWQMIGVLWPQSRGRACARESGSGLRGSRTYVPPQTFECCAVLTLVVLHASKAAAAGDGTPGAGHGHRRPTGAGTRACQAQARAGVSFGASTQIGCGDAAGMLFKKRFRTRQSGSSGGIPDIMVESPNTTTVSRASTIAAANQPHLLSPEMHQPSLPLPADAANFAVSDSDQWPLLPLPEFYLTTPSAVGIANEDERQLPAGFVPMSTADTPHDFGAPKAKGPRYSYEVAPIPPGVVYPDPPGRRSATPGRRSATPHAAAGVSLPPSPSSTPSPRGRRGSLSGHFSPLSLPLAFVASPFARAPSD
ncbi:hypothetical protein POSPLADRAFT_1063336 [Postia placenta MAD-698-R-SB12]|uniref:Uncharacterized protein n=1 Tax=Postia placenta MAD-698-R-SB12 TaxID=670580 RepID=A0A1X6MHR4_9APHY|nr:hypothetical protein POSPLADRAFT_1063336 [Postia placenta MAD-698-R-SB12]OSX55895.1 hypothetical protein POSPLADRAFT_1063336 [Postia placenta MAD-698-R-SB12]